MGWAGQGCTLRAGGLMLACATWCYCCLSSCHLQHAQRSLNPPFSRQTQSDAEEEVLREEAQALSAELQEVKETRRLLQARLLAQG